MRPLEHEKSIPLEHEAIDPTHAFLRARDMLLYIALDHLYIRLVPVPYHVGFEYPEQAPHRRCYRVRLGVPAPDALFAERGDPFLEFGRWNIERGRPEQRYILRHALHALPQERGIFLQRRLPISADTDDRLGIYAAHFLVYQVQQPQISLVLRFHRRTRNPTPTLVAAVAIAEPETLFALLEREAVEAEFGNFSHAREDVVRIFPIAQAH